MNHVPSGEDNLSIGDGPTMGGDRPSGNIMAGLAPERSLGQYRLLRAMPTRSDSGLYEAENTVNGKRVALRVLAQSPTEAWIDMFRSHSRRLMALDHAHLGKVLHAGIDDACYYLTMDWDLPSSGDPVTLETLLGREERHAPDLKTSGGLPESSVRRIAAQICAALEYLHANGISHGRLNADNILILLPGAGKASPGATLPDNSRTLVVNAGLTIFAAAAPMPAMAEEQPDEQTADKSLGDARTRTHDDPADATPKHRSRLDDLAACAPDQRVGGGATAEADIYAFGHLLYRLLTGRSPEGRFKLPSSFGLSRKWDAAIERCLDPAPSRRPTAAELRRMLFLMERRKPSSLFSRAALAALVLVAAIAAYRYARVAPAPADRGRDLAAAMGGARRPRAMTAPRAGRDWEVAALDLTLVWIPPGRATIGSSADERAWADGLRGGSGPRSSRGEQNHFPVHLQDGFWMGQTPVTRGMFRRYIEATGQRTDSDRDGRVWAPDAEGDMWNWHWRGHRNWRDPGFPQEDNHPVVAVSWNDAMAFCDWLTRVEREAGRLPDGHVYRLPGEIEWEIAARGGRPPSRFWWGDDLADGRGRMNGLGLEVDPGPPSEGPPHDWDDGFPFTSPVDHFGARGRNGYGLADLAGNVWEWCYDGFDRQGPSTDIVRDITAVRVLRGGAYRSPPQDLRVAKRDNQPPWTASVHRGFRIALAPEIRP